MDKQTDPVCGMQIEKADAAGQADYEGRTSVRDKTAISVMD